MVNNRIENFTEYIKNVGMKMIDERLNTHSQSYRDAIESLRVAISNNAYITLIEFDIDEYIEKYFEEHPYDGDEYSPFYMVGEIPVIVPYAYLKLNIDDSDEYLRVYFNRVIDIYKATYESGVTETYIHQEIEDINTRYARGIVENKMPKLTEFLCSFDHREPAAYTFVDFILHYFKYVYGKTKEELEYILDDILTSNVLVDADIAGTPDERERSRFYLYLLCIEGYLTFFNKDIFPDKKMISLYIFRAKISFEFYLDLFSKLITYSNKIDLSDELFQALNEKIMNFTLFYLMPDKYLEENLRDEKSAKELLKIL